MVTMVTMVLSWSRALSVRSGGRPTALFSLFRDTSGRKGGERGCESGRTHAQRTFTDAKMPGVIHASVPRLVLHRALLAPSSLLIVCQSVQQSLARGKGEYGAFLRRIRRADTNRPREISPQRSRNGTTEILPENTPNLSFSRGRSCDLDRSVVEWCTVYILICQITFPLCPAFSPFFSSPVLGSPASPFDG